MEAKDLRERLLDADRNNRNDRRRRKDEVMTAIADARRQEVRLSTVALTAWGVTATSMLLILGAWVLLRIAPNGAAALLLWLPLVGVFYAAAVIVAVGTSIAWLVRVRRASFRAIDERLARLEELLEATLERETD